MSMLSAQVDRLRELATRCDELQVGAVRAVRVPLNIGSILREAADTIWELRNKCADLVGERERLFRANVEKNGEILRLVGENAKLRELVRDMNKCLEHCKLVCEYCKFQGVDCQWFRFNKRMRELEVGVE